MRNIAAIFKKQIKDTFKNKTVLIQFIMFPILTLVMNNAVQIDGMPENFFVNLFASMYIGMAPLTSIAAIISEEKETNTLRVLMMSNVKPYEYLSGIGSYIFFACILGASIICVSGNYTLHSSLVFMVIMAIGIFISLLLGAAIGTLSKTQMMATSLTVPVMMILSFLPMLSMFNTTIAKIARFTYSEQISLMIDHINSLQLEPGDICIIVANLLLFAALFIVAYKKCGYEST